MAKYETVMARYETFMAKYETVMAKYLHISGFLRSSPPGYSVNLHQSHSNPGVDRADREVA